LLSVGANGIFLRRLLPGGVDNVTRLIETDEEEFSASSQTPLRHPTTSLSHELSPAPETHHSRFPAGSTTVLTPTYSSGPSKDMLDHLKVVYSSSIHLQPLPLLDTEDLEQLSQMRSQEYLLNSFCALTILFSEQGYYSEHELTFARERANSAREVVNSLALAASPQPDVLQALCLLALYDMKRTWHYIQG